MRDYFRDEDVLLIAQTKPTVTVVTPHVHEALGIKGYAVLRPARDVYDSLIVKSFDGYRFRLDVKRRLVSGNNMFSRPTISQLSLLATAKRKDFAIIGEYNRKRYAYCCLDDVLPFAIKKRPVNRFESGNLRGDRMSALTQVIRARRPDLTIITY
jgi:hypothetical protein